MRWLWGSKKDKNSSSEEVKQETPVMESTFDIDIMPTPNPNALKFVVSHEKSRKFYLPVPRRVW